jgi:hypothetical protein
MATVQDICERSLRTIGIRDFTDTDRQTEAISALNSMLTSWRKELHPVTINESFTVTSGTGSYTIGATGVYVTDRPIKIISAYIKDSSGMDHEVDTTMTQEEYNEIYNKTQTGRPERLYYHKSNALGIIYFDLVPSDTETLYISSLKPYATYTALSDTFLLPLEYEEMVVMNLALRLAPEYFMEAPQTVITLASQLREEIGNENMEPVPLAKMPSELLR